MGFGRPGAVRGLRTEPLYRHGPLPPRQACLQSPNCTWCERHFDLHCSPPPGTSQTQPWSNPSGRQNPSRNPSNSNPSRHGMPTRNSPLFLEWRRDRPQEFAGNDWQSLVDQKDQIGIALSKHIPPILLPCGRTHTLPWAPTGRCVPVPHWRTQSGPRSERLCYRQA